MKIRHFCTGMLVVVIVIAGAACRSEFEKARLSNDPEYVLKEANNYYDNKDYVKAQTLYELVLNQYRGTAEAEEIYFRYANTFYMLNQFTLSAHYFKNFATTFAYSKYREEADFMSAYSHYELSPTFRLEQSSTISAIQGFQDFVNTYPNSARVPECNELIDELRAKLEQKAFASSQLYFDLRIYDAAIRQFENMLTEFPETEKAELVNFRILEAAYHYAENSVFDKREERYEEAIERYQEFVRKYPRSIYRIKADRLYDNIRNNIQNLYE